LKKQQLLRESIIEPTDEIIAEGLGSASDAYTRFMAELKNHDFQMRAA